MAIHHPSQYPTWYSILSPPLQPLYSKLHVVSTTRSKAGSSQPFQSLIAASVLASNSSHANTARSILGMAKYGQINVRAKHSIPPPSSSTCIFQDGDGRYAIYQLA